jgi:hypothetical protein
VVILVHPCSYPLLEAAFIVTVIVAVVTIVAVTTATVVLIIMSFLPVSLEEIMQVKLLLSPTWMDH